MGMVSTPRHLGSTLRLASRSRDQTSAPPDPAEAAARKEANLRREREEHEAAVARRRQQTREILALLRTHALA